MGKGAEILREIQVTHLIIFLGAELNKRGMDFLVDGATHFGESEAEYSMGESQETVKGHYQR